MSGADVIIIGAGALGSAVAAELSLRGRRVAVLAPDEVSASARAAGMIAPAFESVLDQPEHADILRQAAGLWPDFAAATGVRLYREGAEWRGGDPAAMAARLEALGFRAEQSGGTVLVRDEARVDPEQALVALAESVDRHFGTAVALGEGGGRHEVRTDSGETLRAGAVVLATGWAPPACGLVLPPIRPIKGQAMWLKGPAPERVLRGEGVYVAPRPGGVMVGATMGDGESDIGIDPEVTRTLMDRAIAIWPELAGAELVEAYAGIRGASPDGLPYAGRLAPGVHAALAPRRNGWLLAPLVARIVADAMEGGDPDAMAEAMDPGRLT